MRRLPPLAVVPLAVALVLVLGTCDDQPTIPVPESSSRDISDAVYDAEGNPHFFWLPPLVTEPETFNGPFDGDSDPVVTICELTDTGCTLLLHESTGVEAVYTVSGGPGGVVVQVDPVEEHFLVTWHTDEFNTATETAYQIQVTLGSTLLGFADVTLTETGREVTKKNEIGEETVIALKDGRTLPVTFRIEEGAICADPTQPCTTATVDAGEEKTVTLTDEQGEVFSEVRFPSGWAATDENGDPVDALTLTIQKLPVVPTEDPEDPSCLLVVRIDDPATGEPENCVELRLDTDTEFDVQVTFVRTDDGFLPVLTFCPDEDVLALPEQERARYVMTSVEEDVADPAIQNRRTYEGVAGLDCISSETIGFGGGSPEGLLAQGARLLGSVAALLLPEKLWAIDVGFGGELDECCTIFFFAIDKEAEVVTAPTVTEAAVGADLGTVEVKVSSTHPEGEDQPLPGEEVTFSFLKPEFPVGTFDQNTVVTDESGIAAHNWTLGAAGGRNTLFIFGAASDTARLEVLGLGRVSLWKGDGDETDAVGQNHGVRENIDPEEEIQSDPFATGIVGQAFNFDGTGDVVSFPARNIRTAPHLTVATWVNLDPDGPADEIQRFVTLGPTERAVLRQNNPPDGGARQLHFFMSIDDEGDGFDEDGTDLHHITLNNALATGCWHHLAGTYDGTTMRLYLDGNQVGSQSVSGVQWPDGFGVRLSHPADDNDGVLNSETLWGRLDEVEVHNVPLTGTEIGAIWNNTPPPAGEAKCGEGQPAARLILQSQEGDFIGQGGTFDITYTPENSDFFTTQIRRTVEPDDAPALLLFTLGSVSGEEGNTFTNVSFGTDQLGIPIQPGFYPDAERADFASPGHPGLDVSFQNRGCNEVTGEFTIDHVTFFRGSSGTEIERFSASFEQHCEGNEPALFGTFVYNVHGDLPDIQPVSPLLHSVNSSDDGLTVTNLSADPLSPDFVGPLDPDLDTYITPIAMGVAQGDETVYVWNNSNRDPATGGTIVTGVLLTVDVCTGLATPVDAATPPQGVLDGLAVRSDGQIFGTNLNLVTIDPLTGVATTVGSLGSGYRVAGLDFDSNGTLYGLAFNGDLVTIDTSTGQATQVAPLDTDVGIPGSLVFDPLGRLLGTGFGGPSGSIIFEIDPSTGAVSNVRSHSRVPQGMGFVDGCSS